MKKNILLTIPKMQIGGAETYVLSLANDLADRGHRVIVVSSGGCMTEALRQDILHVSMPIHYNIISSVGRLILLIRKYKIDVIHGNSIAACWASWLAARITGIPYVVTVHSLHEKTLEKIPFAGADRIITVSREVQRHIIKKWRIPREKTVVIYNGIDLRKYKRSLKKTTVSRPVVTMVARFSEAKGQQDLFKAVPGILRHFPHTQFWLVGDGPQRKKYKEMLTGQPWASSVVIKGLCTDVPQILSESDVVVLPSHREALGYSLIEAIASYKPVVASKVGGIPEVVTHGYNGYLIEPRNAAQLQERVLQLLLHPELAGAMGEAGRKMAEEKFNLAAMVEATEQIYAELS